MGSVLTGDVEVEARCRAPRPWDCCTQDDIADSARLRISALPQHSRVPEYSHPGTRLAIFALIGLD